MPIIVTLTDTPVSALTIIKRAMRLIGVLSSGKTPSTNEQADGLEALNALLDSWRNKRLMTYAFQEEPLTTTGVQTYTVGSAGNLNTNRPVKIEAAYYSKDGVNTPVKILDEKGWASIAQRTQTGDRVEGIHYSPQMPLGNLNVYPIASGGVLYLVTRTALVAFADVSTTTYLAPGWKEALQTNLALSLAPEFERPVSRELKDMARDAKKGIMATNGRPILLQTELASLVGDRSSFNVITGE